MPAALNREEIVPKLCERLAQGEFLSVVCREKGMPSRSVLYEWMDQDEGIRTAVARARDLGFDQRAEEAVEEAKSCEDPAKARLAFDAERWYLAKLNPKRYGERIQTAQTDTDGNDVAPGTDAHAVIPSILAAARQRKDSDGSDLA